MGEYPLKLEHKCRDCDWTGGRGDLDTDQCPECGSFNIRTQRW